MNEKRGPFYLLTGLIIGAVVGVLATRLLLPVRYTDTEPSTLRTDQREVYRNLVSRAYLAEADVNRARSRLNLLKDTAMVEELIAQAQNALASTDQQANARAMALLAAALSKTGIQVTPLPGVVTPLVMTEATSTPGAVVKTITPTAAASQTTITSTPANTASLRATATPQPTQGSPYQMVSKEDVCLPGAAPLMRIHVQDSQGNPVMGVKIEITLVNSAPAYFFTGLYPEIDNGYADYLMISSTLYSLRVGEGGQLVTGLQAPVCTADGSSYTGGLKLVFKQP
jgi:protocatechuate 3,4-dioxygenase beta subunit